MIYQCYKHKGIHREGWPMMGTRQKLKGGAEWDAIRARHCYKYIWHHSHNIKKALARLERRVVKNNLKMFAESA